MTEYLIIRFMIYMWVFPTKNTRKRVVLKRWEQDIAVNTLGFVDAIQHVLDREVNEFRRLNNHIVNSDVKGHFFISGTNRD